VLEILGSLWSKSIDLKTLESLPSFVN